MIDFMGRGDNPKFKFSSLYLPPMGWKDHLHDAGILGPCLITPTYKTIRLAWNGVLGFGETSFKVEKYQFKVITGKTNPIKDVKGIYNNVANYFKNNSAKDIAKDAGNFVANNWFEIGLSLAMMKFGTEKPAGAGVLTREALLEKSFSSGASKLMSTEQLAAYPNSTTYGNPVSTFVAPTSEIDALLNQGLSRADIAKRLGIEDELFMKGDLVRVDIEATQLKNMNLRVATGQEGGANNLFVPGGKTIGGVSEGIVDGISKTGNGVSSKVIKQE